MKMKKCSKGTTRIHDVRFYNLTPRSINCYSFSKQLCKLALSRNDASIEIWDMCYAAFLEKTIPGEANSSIEGITWAGDRLFTVGISGEVCEWDLCRLNRKRSNYVTGSAIWCIDLDREEQSIAMGTEEGYINIFDITGNDLQYKKVFDKQDGRILCCKFNENGKFIVTGSVDAIRIWDTETGHAIRKIALPRTEVKRETIVWSLQVLRNFTIISADSRGQVNVWDGKTGVQIESHQVLTADVLAVAVNEDEDILVCTGIEPVIRIFALAEIKKEDRVIKKWVKFLQRSVHDHDVKALVCAGLKIFSGGVDGYLGISSCSKEKFHQEIIKHGPFLQSPCAYVSSEAKFILLRYTNYLELWKLGIPEDQVRFSYDDSNHSKRLLTLEKAPEKLLELRSKNDETIISTTISPNGSWLIYSTMTSIRIFFVEKKEKLSISRLKDVPEQFTSSIKVLFSSDSKTIFLVKLSNQVDIFSILSNTEIDYSETIATSKAIKDIIQFAQISNCGNYFIAAGTCRTIAVWMKNYHTNQWKHYLNLPRYMVPTTAIAIHKHVPRIVASFTDGKIFEYDLEEMRFTCSSSEQFVPNSYTHCINNIVLDPRNEDVIILHNDSQLFVLEKIPSGGSTERNESSKKKKNQNDSGDIPPLKLTFSKTYQHFVHLDWLSENELVVVGVNPVSLMEQLPGALRQKKFGAS